MDSGGGVRAGETIAGEGKCWVAAGGRLIEQLSPGKVDTVACLVARQLW